MESETPTTPEDEKVVTATGAVRCAKVAGEKGKFPHRYDLISPIGLTAVAHGYSLKIAEEGSGWEGRNSQEHYNLIWIYLTAWQTGQTQGTLEKALAHWAELERVTDTKTPLTSVYHPGLSLDNAKFAERNFDGIPPIFLANLAEAYGEGSLKYDAHNWWKGFSESMLLNHAFAHLLQWRSGDTSENHLGHGSWNLIALAHFRHTRPELLDLQRAIVEANPYEGQAYVSQITES